MRGLGGILYTALALAYLGRGAIEVWLCCKIGEDIAAEVMHILASCPYVRPEGVQVVQQANFHSQIQYLAGGGKEERLIGDLPPVAWVDLAPLAGSVNGWLVNFITGLEVDLPTLGRLRESSAGPVLMDVHSLTLGRAADGRRFLNKPAAWPKWIALADVVQMNEIEAGLLAGWHMPARADLETFVKLLLTMGPQASALTLGAEGGVGAWRAGPRDRICSFEAEEPDGAVDTTGCGDVFLAGLGAGLFGGRPFDECLQGAAKAAGLNSRLKGVAALEQLAELELL